MIMTEILAAIGGTTLILTAAVRVPAALAEFLRACLLMATAARELHAVLTKREHHSQRARLPIDMGPQPGGSPEARSDVRISHSSCRKQRARLD